MLPSTDDSAPTAAIRTHPHASPSRTQACPATRALRICSIIRSATFDTTIDSVQHLHLLSGCVHGWNPRQGAFVRGQVLVFHPNARKLSTNTTSLVIISMRVDGMATYSASHHGSVSGLWLVRHRSSVNNLDRGPASFVLAVTFTCALAHG